MFRKLAAFFFDEEEIILEEDLQKDEEENYRIPEIQPMKAQSKKIKETKIKKEEPVKEVVYETKEALKESLEIKEEKIKVLDSSEDKVRSKKITVDLDDAVQQNKAVAKNKVPEKKTVEEEYQPQEIISPIFGGSNKEPAQAIKVNPEPIKTKTQTTVISPMYGLVEDEESEIFDEELLNYDLKDMLSSREDAEEVQVSLYDFLEEFEDEK